MPEQLWQSIEDGFKRLAEVDMLEILNYERTYKLSVIYIPPESSGDISLTNITRNMP